VSLPFPFPRAAAALLAATVLSACAGDGRPRGQRPLLILNAADMVTGTVFPFTQYHLDLLCSDLRQVKLSTAVAASAAFPVAMSPVTLRNYSVCPAQERRADWPPVWIEQALATDYHVNADRLRRGRVARTYAQADQLEAPFGARYVHLLDGGTADNLGISEPFRLITTADVSPTLLNDIMVGRIKRVVFVLVNARSQAANALNDQLATPGIVDMLLGTINTSIDNATFGNLDRIRTLLRERLEAVADDPNTPEPVKQRLRGFQSHFLPVDFAAIPDRDCRRTFQAIATSWTLPDHEIDALLEVAGPLLAADLEFDRVLQAVGASYAAPNAGLQQACETVMRAEAS